MKPYEALRQAAELIDPAHGFEGLNERFAASFALVAMVCESMMDTLEEIERKVGKVGDA